MSVKGPYDPFWLNKPLYDGNNPVWGKKHPGEVWYRFGCGKTLIIFEQDGGARKFLFFTLPVGPVVLAPNAPNRFAEVDKVRGRSF